MVYIELVRHNCNFKRKSKNVYLISKQSTKSFYLNIFKTNLEKLLQTFKGAFGTSLSLVNF